MNNMEIVVGKNAGFCGGVLNSINKANDYLKKYDKLYCLGELVHNQQVIDKLKENGLTFIESLDEVNDNSNVIVRAHGISKNIYETAQKRNINLLDLTCPKVLNIHKMVTSYQKDGYFIVLVAHKTHPEVIGTISFCGKNSCIIENIEEIDETIKKIEESNIKKIAVLAQTTFSLELFNDMTEEFKKRLGNYELLINNTICNATEKRQKEVKDLASQVNAMIIIGGKNSSNTKKLYEISKNICEQTYLVETVKELENDFNEIEKVGVMAGASTPKESIDEVINYLKGLNATKN